MDHRWTRFQPALIAIGVAVLLALGGCQIPGVGRGPVGGPKPGQPCAAAPLPVPREMAKSVLPTYCIEPPDVLLIEAVHIVPRSPIRLRAFDLLQIQVTGTLPDAPINGAFRVEPGGTVRLGFHYGSVMIGGLSTTEAEAVIQQKLLACLREPIVSVSLIEVSAKQQIGGQHLVAPDGTVTLGSYGSVPVAGLTHADARETILAHLGQFLEEPEVSLDVYAYNSKVYYVIVQGAGMGDGVYRFPVTGNDTVLDAISHINGLTQVSSKKIWIARPTDDPQVMQTLPVNWEQITAQGLAGTNYQLFPGDRVFIAEDRLIAIDTSLAKIIAPFERIMGFTLLSTGTATRLSGNVLQGGGNKNSNF
jgi:polysaccharide export outer membrane protein